MTTSAEDRFPIIGMDAVVFAVGNAKQAAHYHSTAFGMRRVAYRGPETGCPDEVAHVLESSGVRFVFRAAARPGTRLGERVAAHLGGVVDLALESARPRRPTTTRGRTAPSAWRRRISSRTGRQGHRGRHRDLWRYAAYAGRALRLLGRLPLPGYVPTPPIVGPGGRGSFTEIDHCVGNVELGKMDEWVDFYHRAMGFTNMKEFIGDDIATEYSALMSKVVADERPACAR